MFFNIVNQSVAQEIVCRCIEVNSCIITVYSMGDQGTQLLSFVQVKEDCYPTGWISRTI